MRVIREFPPYNDRRWSMPWIAIVTAWPIGGKPELRFGGLIGLTAEIEAVPGMVVRWGQKDMRGRGTRADWGVIQADGSIVGMSAERCRDHWLAGCPVPMAEDAA